MISTSILRARTTYILQFIEKQIGEFAIERQRILAAGSLESNELAEEDAAFRGRIEESYLGDLFGIALSVTRGTSDYAELLHILQLAEALDIYEIRNACAHPNRPFLPHYWYRAATLAQDPSFRVLGLESVSEALARAESDSFTSASDGWSIALRVVKPNNLPAVFEHDRTGLLGREALVAQVAKQLCAGRFPTVALVAPGGAGKTAVALEVLKRIAYSSIKSAAEAVVYVTLKSRRLTASGVVLIEDEPTLDVLEERIESAVGSVLLDDSKDGLEALFARHAEREFVICIDNLESVLLGSAKEFEDFLAQVPSRWKVLITSRVPLNAAHCVSVSVLPGKVAENLAMGYSRSIGVRLDTDKAPLIASLCQNNPLAIKLTIDAIGAGKEIEVAALSASSDTLRYSYDRLMDALSPQCLSVLEVIFVAGAVSCSDITLLLEQDHVSVAAALGQLNRTSLVHSVIQHSVEVYSLNDAVRELLRVSPRSFDLRADVSAKIARRRAQVDGLRQQAKVLGETEGSPYFVPEEQPIALKEVSQLIRRSKGDDLQNAMSKLSIIEGDCRSLDTFWLLRGIALSKLRDPEAETALRRAVEIGDSVRSLGYLAHWLELNRRYPEASDVYLAVKEKSGCQPNIVGEYMAVRNMKSLLFTTVFASRYVKVMHLTEELVREGRADPAVCSARMSAARMLYHQTRNIEYLEEVVEVFGVAQKAYGYAPEISREAMKQTNDLWTDCVAGRLEEAALKLICTFVIDHYDGFIVAAPTHLMVAESWAASKLLNFADLLPEDDERKLKLLKMGGADPGKLSVEVLSVPVRICDFTYSPENRYRFGVDRDGRRHYLRIESFEGGGPEWSQLLPGRQVYIVPGATPESREECPRAEKVSVRPILS